MRKSLVFFLSATLIFKNGFTQNTFPWPSTGNIGIGTTAPTKKLDVRGDIYTNSTVYIDGGDLFLSRVSQSFGYVVRPNTAGFRNLGFCAAGGATLDAISFISINSTFSGSVGITGTCSIDVGDLYLKRVSDPYGYVIRPNTTGFKKLAFAVVGGGPLENVLVNSTISQFTGSVCINTATDFGYKLAVNGKAIFTEAKVKLYANWPDYVFYEDHNLMPIAKLEKFISANHHLPNIPSAEEVKEKEGFELGNMNVKLLEKVEELTLYIIELNKATEELKKENVKIKETLKRLSAKK